jgi:hypothetical protein
MGAHHHPTAHLGIVTFCTQNFVLLVKSFIRDVLDDEARANTVFKEGQQLVNEMFAIVLHAQSNLSSAIPSTNVSSARTA